MVELQDKLALSRLASIYLVSLIGLLVPLADSNQALSTINIDGEGYKENRPVISSRSYNATCTARKQLKSTASVRYGGCANGNSFFDFPVVYRDAFSIVAAIEPAQFNGIKYIRIKCCGFDGEPEAMLTVCEPLQQPVVTISQYLAPGQDALRVHFANSTTDQRRHVDCLASMVNRSATIRTTYSNNLSITQECTSLNSMPDMCELNGITRDLNKHVTVRVTDWHYYSWWKTDLIQTVTTVVEAKASDVALLERIQSVECYGSATGQLVLTWSDTTLYSSEERRQVETNATCNCTLLTNSDSTATSIGGIYNGTLTNSESTESRLSLSVPYGARCVCELKRRFGTSALVSETTTTTCDSDDEFTTKEPDVIAGKFGVEENSDGTMMQRSVSVYIVLPDVRELHGVAKRLRVRVLDAVGSRVEREVEVNASRTYVVINKLSVERQYVLEVQVATRKGYSETNKPTELRIGRLQDTATNARTQSSTKTGTWKCNVAAIGRSNTSSLAFLTRCSTTNEAWQRRVNVDLVALACRRAYGGSLECGRRMFTGRKSLVNVTIDEINEAVVSVWMGSNEDKEAVELYQAIVSSSYNAFVLFGQSVSVQDSETGEFLFGPGLIELFCAYRGDEVAENTKVAALDGKPPRVEFAIGRCDSAASGQRGLITKLHVRYCLKTAEVAAATRRDDGSCHYTRTFAPFALQSEEKVSMSLDETRLDEVYDVDIGFSSCWEGTCNVNWRKEVLTASCSSTGLRVWQGILLAFLLLLVIILFVVGSVCFYNSRRKRRLAQRRRHSSGSPPQPDEYLGNEPYGIPQENTFFDGLVLPSSSNHPFVLPVVGSSSSVLHGPLSDLTTGDVHVRNSFAPSAVADPVASSVLSKSQNPFRQDQEKYPIDSDQLLPSLTDPNQDASESSTSTSDSLTASTSASTV